MNGWEDVTGDDSPFSGVDDVDGIVYTDAVQSPELRSHSNPSTGTPMPEFKPAPTRPQRRSLGPWTPGGEVDPAAYQARPKRPSPIKPFLIGLIPLAVVFGLVLFVMDLYGMR